MSGGARERRLRELEHIGEMAAIHSGTTGKAARESARAVATILLDELETMRVTHTKAIRAMAKGRK